MKREQGKMGKLIYIVDDEKEICELLKIALETRKYQVQVGHNGDEAINMVHKKKPDLLMIDLKMPRMNGYEVIAALKSDKDLAEIPIMVMTSLTRGTGKSDEDWRKSLEVCDFISKPFDPVVIVQRVQGILGE